MAADTSTTTTIQPPPPSLDYLDNISSSLPKARQRVYSPKDLEVFNLLDTPCWVFDVRQKAMWWSNQAGIDLWNATSLEDLLARDFAEGMSKANINSMTAWLERFYHGETNRLTWTFHPNQGRDGPKTCNFRTSGIYVNSKNPLRKTTTTTTSGAGGEEKEDPEAEEEEEPWFCMLVEVEKVTLGADRTPEDARMIRRTEMLRHFPIIARQFNFEGNLVDQNPEAMAVFGSPSNAEPSESIAPKPSSSVSLHHSRRGSTSSRDEDCCTMSTSSHRTGSSTTTEGTTTTTAPNDFLAQFVDIEEGKQVWEEAKEGNDYSTETLQYTLQGQSWFSIDVRQVWDPVTSEKVIIYSARDISKLMQYAKDQAEKQNQARNEFFAVMAHEIKTPCHQVIGSMELLLQSQLDDDQADNVQILQTSSKAMMAIINDALDFTKLEAGKLSLERIQFEVRGVVEGCVAAVQQQAENKGLRINMIIDERIPAWLVGDPNRLRQVLINLLSNAVKFSASGTIEVKAKRMLDDTSSRVVLHFSVQDHGIGISTRKQALIFDAYQQADTSVSRTYGGTGLGLSICKSLVELMGGTVGVQSELKKGSTFWFELPFQQYDSVTTTSKQQRTTTTSTTATTEAANNPTSYRILVVEDNKVNQKVICKMLQRLGHTTNVAENGQVALEALQHQITTTDPPSSSTTDTDHEQFDLVLMDWQMPVMDGIEATKAIRRLGHTKTRLPVIGLTASILGRDWLDVGMNECLKKPIRLNELKAALSRNMAKS